MTNPRKHKQGLRCLKSLRDEVDVAACLREIAAGKADIGICLRELTRHARVQALMSWFGEGDLASFKHWSYVAGKLRCLMFKHWPYDSFHVCDHLMPLVSDCSSLVEWLSNLETPYSPDGYYSNPKRTSNPAKPDFTDYNVLLALRGEWALLAERSERFLKQEATRRHNYRSDHRFFIGLASGDRSAMRAALAELVDPALMARRTYDDESSATRRFICTSAIVYAKIAARHGHTVALDSPWVPPPWMPISPLAAYADPYPFMRAFQAPLPLRAVS